ncbi:divergent polysaccharide deacetylase family protein [Chelatococcus daeguensis]|uniref:divergent polysaccharide deacetylase family protein n=1 Tax=Chelatococcus daeguensis TaxID=444444 RepID=UPI0007ABDFB0|nr:divergent polysaccharide deacetylase family protein [Chelatococcus daeguensis]KZE33811.1 hypothetical protein AVW15_18395 [Chelatococcus daeguensis]MBM3082891.1 divergent polysaccharide deacetylase family protein [Chelatococcus daeguensis]
MPQATLKDLDKPLGRDNGRRPAASGRERLLRFGLVWGVAIGAVLLFGGHLLTGGLISRSALRPAATPVAAIPAVPAKADVPAATKPAPPSNAAPPASNRRPASDIEQQAGVAVVRPAGNVPGAIIISVPDGSEPGLAPAPDPRVTADTPAGPLPRIGDDGSRAAEVYARPTPPHAAMAPARIAVVVDGLGLSEAATRQAIETLPADVTLALAAAGVDLPQAAAAARQSGHEVLLSLPAEIPGGDLITAMARFAGYAGILTATSADRLGPLAQQAEQRGLLLMAAGRSDLLLPQTMPAEAVEQAFARAERLAQRNGRAIVVAEGSPSLLRQLARWTASLERRGVLLVPATSLIANSKG